MDNYLSNQVKIKGHKEPAKRIGRGIGSGKGGHTSTKGHKGHKARKGGQTKNWYEGGQTPIIKRMPYIKGFTRYSRRSDIAFNLSDIEGLFEKNKQITPELLISEGYVKNPNLTKGIKILSKGELTSAIDFKGFQYTRKASEKILKAGGKTE